jgi:enoyl-CoA hydratase
MDYKILKPFHADGVMIITISRPEALNALNTEFFTEMDNLLDEVAKDDSVKVILLTGEGKAFVAGADIAEMVDKNSSEGTKFSSRGQGVFLKMEKLDKPIIAAINGFALGGGLELALACDIRLASSKAKFGQPEVNLGLIPGFAATQRLPRLIGTGNALWLLMTAEIIDAAEALRVGLVQKVFDLKY